MLIKKATQLDLDGIAAIYSKIIASEHKKNTGIGWIANVYPTRETAAVALGREDLFAGFHDGRIVSSAIINKMQMPEYAGGKWQNIAPDNKIMVIHTLVTDPDFAGRGFGKKFILFYEDYAGRNGCNTLRLDTNARNAHARAFYARLGYTEAGIIACDFNGIKNIDLVLLEKRINPVEQGE